MKLVKRIIIALLVICLLWSVPCYAKTTYCYTTQTAKLSKDLKVKYNTKVKLVKTGKQCLVDYKGNQYKINKKYLSNIKSVKKYSGKYLRRAGRIRWKGYVYTWYSQRVLPGRGLKIPGRHLDKQGFVCDKDGYIVIGSSISNKLKKRIMPTPFGKFGKCYDCGAVGSKHADCYVAW